MQIFKKLASLTLVLAAVAFLAPAVEAGEGHEGEKMKGEKTIQGCLADGDMDGWYVLTVIKEDKNKAVKVEGDDSFEAHIGHEVELTGTWVKEGDSKHFAAAGMKHLAATCK